MEHAQQIYRISFCSLFLILFFSIELTAQEYLGEWSFKEVDTITQKLNDEQRHYNVVAKRMFKSTSFNFYSADSCKVSMLGRKMTLGYNKRNDTLFINQLGVVYINNDSVARFSAGKKVSMVLRKGKPLKLEKQYKYLTSNEYEPIDYNKDFLPEKKWKVVEVKMSGEETEEEALKELLFMQKTFHFVDNSYISSSLLGMDVRLEWKKGDELGSLLIESKNKKFKKYIVHHLDNKQLIISDDDGNVMYLIPSK